MDPLLRGIDPWAEPDFDGCPVCRNDGGEEDDNGVFQPCPRCYPDGVVA
jgi:hypothetical protein